MDNYNSSIIPVQIKVLYYLVEYMYQTKGHIKIRTTNAGKSDKNMFLCLCSSKVQTHFTHLFPNQYYLNFLLTLPLQLIDDINHSTRM